MIPFFRKIRKKMADDNKPLKYMRYAIGEIVLVVVGILIALAINNWNEERKTQQRLRDFLTEIQNDLSNDILRANYLIDDYLRKDSILRNIKYSKITYTVENMLEDGEALIFTFFFENLRLQTKGYDGLVNNIDNIPKEYKELMGLLNRIYISNNYDMTTISERVQSNSYANRDDLNNKDWSGHFWDRKVNDSIFQYFQSKEYINMSRNYFNDYSELIQKIILFKIDAIDAYNQIAMLINSKNPTPEHINYMFPDSELLNQFTGNYHLIYAEFDYDDKEMIFEIEDNQLQWHYIYEDINVDQKFNVPLYWHNGYIFFNNQAAAIFEFQKINDRISTFKSRGMGSESIFVKK